MYEIKIKLTDKEYKDMKKMTCKEELAVFLNTLYQTGRWEEKLI